MNPPLRSWPTLVAALLFLTAHTAAASGSPRLAILAVDRLTLEDVTDRSLPNLDRLMREGEAGLMTTRLPGGLSPQRMYLSIGAGEPEEGGPGAELAYDADEYTSGMSAGDEYRLQHGTDAPQGAVVHLGLARLSGDGGSAGRLGDVLAGQGLRLAVLGNADRGGAPGREAVTMLMDAHGCVALGSVGRETLAPDWNAPGGWRTDYDALRRGYDDLAARADVVLIVLGDLARLNEVRPVYEPPQAGRYERTALQAIDGFIGYLMDGSRRPDGLMLVVASPPMSEVSAGRRLTPFAFWGPGVEPGLAYSTSTRRPGIIAPYDLTATIASFCGIRPEDATLLGRVIESRPGNQNALPAYYADLVSSYRLRNPVLATYGYLILLVTLGAVLFPARSFLRSFLTGLALVPLFFLIFAPIPIGLGWLTLVLTGAAAVLSGRALERLVPIQSARLAIVGLATAAFILADAALGSPLLSRSLLGYSPIAGARFYGLGNEYLGVVLGAAILGGTALYSLQVPRVRLLLAAIFAGVALLVILPGSGANVGGGLAAAAGLGYTYCLLTRGRVGPRSWAAIILAALLLLCVGIAADFFGGRGQLSHLGRAVLWVRRDGLAAALAIVHNKLSFNLGLLQYTGWTWALLGLLVLGPLALRYPPAWLPGMFRIDHPLLAGLRGMFVTALAGLIVNDSGVVVAATVMIYLGLALAHLPNLQQRRRVEA